MAITQVFQQLQQLGVFDVLLPFILVFTVVFAVLQKVKIFDDKRVNTMIALVMGLATIVPHVLWGTVAPDGRLANGMVDVVEVMNNSLPSVSVVIVAILMALIIIGLLGKRVELANTSLSGWIAFLAFIVVIFIFGGSAGWWRSPAWSRSFAGNSDVTALIIVILVFAIIIWFVTKDEGDPDKMTKQGFGDKFGELLAGGGKH